MKITKIVHEPRPARQVKRAAAELASYLHRLFGHSPTLASGSGRAGGVVVHLKVDPRDLSDQGYVLRPIDRSNFAVEGGSPLAVLWGVYDLVESWGVRYELHGWHRSATRPRTCPRAPVP